MTRRVVVVGGGYAGVALIRRLAAKGTGIALTLIDRHPHHTVLTEIHQVAAGRRGPETLQVPYAELDRCRFLQAEVTGLDAGARRVLTSAGPVEYDLLVLGLGGVDTDFGVPGVQAHALTLHSLGEALTIRDRLNGVPPDAPVLIAGGGLTGVELAAQIGLRRQGSGNISLVEAAPNVLPGLPQRLQRRARRRLGTLGVNVLTGIRIARVEERMVHFTDGSALPFALMVWACGVKASPLVAHLGLPVDRSGRALVDANLKTALPGVYAMGDCASGGLPPTAQAASQQGRNLADHLLSLLRAKERPVRPVRLKGTLVDMGHTFAVGAIGDSLLLTGTTPAILKRLNVARWLLTAAGLSTAIRYFLGLDKEFLSIPAGTRVGSAE